MLRFLADEHISKGMISGALRREPALDFARLHEVGLLHAKDETILEWAASQDRIVVSKDHNTLVGHAYARVAAKLPMPGVLMLKEHVTIGQAIEAILIAALAS